MKNCYIYTDLNYKTMSNPIPLYVLLLVQLVCACSAFAVDEHDKDSSKVEVSHPELLASSWESELIKVRHWNDSIDVNYMGSDKLYNDGWDRLSHPQFWKKVMRLSSDSCVINIAKTREVLTKMHLDDWDAMKEKQKDAFRDSIRKAHGLTSSDKIYTTTGKADFYAFDLVLPSISKGVEVFTQEEVDPWYAQAILMIESPGKLARSKVGAYGPFQLMPSVARSHGLKVNKYVDERKDFVRSAQGAASLIKNTCIPEAKKILAKYYIGYNETDLWFRLFVLHIYHAGASNVAAVMRAINPRYGSPALIQQMWQTSAGQFRNASQNYSQLALAALLILDEMILEDCDYVLSTISENN